MQLRKNCNHPDIITADYDQSVMFPPADQLVEQAGKMQLLERLLLRLKRNGHKVLIFSQVQHSACVADGCLTDRTHIHLFTYAFNVGCSVFTFLCML